MKKGKNICASVIALTLMFSQVSTNFINVYANETDGTVGTVIDNNQLNTENAATETVTGNYEQAISEVTFPKYESDGTKEDVHVSDLLKQHLDTTNLTGVKNDNNQTLTFSDVQLKDVYLNSEYLNGVSEAGISFYNMVNYFTDVKQIKQMLDANPGYSVIDSAGNVVDSSYIDELLGLINQILNFDTSTNLKYDYDSVYDSNVFAQNPEVGGTDVIATSEAGNVTLKFHIDSHGWWGYDLGADDSITGLVLGFSQEEIDADHAEHEGPLTHAYANFFAIDMQTKGNGSWYMLRNTDLENPVIYVSEDGKEAFMIDVDFYGENVINKVIKDVIGPECESLKIFLTHNHSDHVNNLAIIAQDERLKDITSIYWPENEPHTQLDGVDLVTLFGEDKVTTIADGQKFSVADHEFQFVEIPDEHTPGGGQLADLTNNVLYSGDTLGAQVHLGGSTVSLSSLDGWLAGAQKTVKYIEDNDINYIIGGHTGYLNNPAYASWVETAMQYAKNQFNADPLWTGGLVIVENGEVVTGDRLGEIFSNGLSDREELNVASANFRNNVTSQVQGDYEQAISEVTFPKYESDGTKEDVHVSDLLKQHLDTTNLTGIKNSTNQTLTFSDVQLKDVYLNSKYLNGVSEAGISFYNMVNYYTDVLQIKQMLDANPGYSVVDSAGNVVDSSYIDELLGLINQILNFDTSTDLKYDMDSVYDSEAFAQNPEVGGTDVIATSEAGNVTFKFHIDSHGWWGYDLGADDSITSLVLGFSQEEIDADRAEHESPITRAYGNFFVIEIPTAGNGSLYMLRNTDLENPIIYVNEDKTEAFMIDVDFYGENVLNKVIKDVIGPDCESLKIFFTHNHGDHVNNLAVIAQDEYLSDIATVYWPENEPHTQLDGVDLVTLFGEDKIVEIADGQKFEAAGHEFQFVEIPDEHTPGGGQVADLTNKILYSGDTLGAQVHLGGTTVGLSSLDGWLAGAQKTVKYIEDNDINYIIGGHTGYLNNPAFASWIETAMQYAKDQLAADASWAGGLVIVENGEVVTEDRLGEIFSNGLSDREELNVASVNFRNDLQTEEPGQDEPGQEDPGQTPGQTPSGDNQNPGTTDDNTQTPAGTVTPQNNQNTAVKTGDNTTMELSLLGLAGAVAVLTVLKKMRKFN
ncbi:MBL fold metallo-hydrolase [uncultured Thomasclavelia sp.]|uniref:MBL fold metallo-hydrolase n=1 Tax=uncultured Thomasclavelia sp. TaxID=3025759 RepID=UPI0025ED86C0|nr:MBL fold metallo-hydrolase [uncultured Thomasclavelia sp.]